MGMVVNNYIKSLPSISIIFRCCFNKNDYRGFIKKLSRKLIFINNKINNITFKKQIQFQNYYLFLENYYYELYFYVLNKKNVSYILKIKPFILPLIDFFVKKTKSVKAFLINFKCMRIIEIVKLHQYIKIALLFLTY